MRGWGWIPLPIVSEFCLGTDPESWVSEFTPQKGPEEVSNLVLLPWPDSWEVWLRKGFRVSSDIRRQRKRASLVFSFPDSCHTSIRAVGDNVWLLQVGFPAFTSCLLDGRFPPSYPPLGWEKDVHLSAQATADQCALGHRDPQIKFTCNYSNVAVTRISASLLWVGRFIEGNKIKGHYY